MGLAQQSCALVLGVGRTGYKTFNPCAQRGERPSGVTERRLEQYGSGELELDALALQAG